MDQLGNAPAPPPSEAAGDITDYIMTHQHKYPYIKVFRKDKIYKIALDYYTKYTPQWSAASYLMSRMEEYTTPIANQYHKSCNNIKRKIRGILRSCALLYLMYRCTLEKRYMPGGAFENEASLTWNPILNSSRACLPEPPPNSPTIMPPQGSGIKGIRAISAMKYKYK